MKYLLTNLKNNFDFFLRQKIKISRKNYYEQNEPKDCLLTTETAIIRECELAEKYDLSSLRSNSTRNNYLENLYLLDILDKYFLVSASKTIKALDVGSKNWFYAKSEHIFFKSKCETFVLDGIELDANRLNTQFYNRIEVAKFHLRGLQSANYIAGNFLNHSEKYDYIVWILPFVVEYPLLKWGLPKSQFMPEEMLNHAYKSLNSGGKMFIINQGESEYKVQTALCEQLQIPYEKIGLIDSEFYRYSPRYLTVISN